MLTTRVIRYSCALVVAVSGSALAAQPFQTILLSGTQAPDAPSGVLVNFFNNPMTTALDDNGDVVLQYVGFPYPTTPNFRNAIIQGHPGSFVTLARANDPATPTGVAGATWAGFNILDHSMSGKTIFSGVLQGPGIDSSQTDSNNSGVLMYASGGSVSLIARNLDQVPGLASGVVYTGLQGGVFSPGVVMNSSGQAVINAYLRGTGIVGSSENALLFRDSTGTITPIAEEQRASGITNINFDSIDNARLNNAGQFIFRATLKGAPGHPFDVTPGVNDFSIWTGTSAGATLFARGDSQISGQAAGVHWGNFSGAPSINDAGQIAMRGTMTGPGITYSVNDLAIFRGAISGGPVDIVAQKGTAAMGTEPGTTFLQMGDPLLAPNGDVAFSARLQGPSITSNVNEYSLYVNRSGVNTLLARQSNQAADLPAGVMYNWLYDMQINTMGDIAFTSTLEGMGVTTANDKAIFAEIGGMLRVVVREGDVLEVAPGVFKTVAALGQTGLSDVTPPLFPSAGANDGQSRMWNDNGQLVYWASFTDGSQGEFIVPVPVPASAGVLAAGLVVCARRRRR